jgi:pimeloyl-ACP methyl ester carboxylesterase
VYESPETILVAQHGWADDNRAMLAFGRAIASPTTLVIAPDLGYRRTWLRMAPLIDTAEQAVEHALQEHPAAILRIVGHSMGGLIWIDLLTRRLDWRQRTDRLVLIGCPVGGANLAAMLDPLGLTISRDLIVDRRTLAEALVPSVPTLVIVGDLLGPHDGTVSHESARVADARFIRVPSSSHAGLRRSRWVTALVRAFMECTDPPPLDLDALSAQLQTVSRLRATNGQMLQMASVRYMFQEGSTIRTLKLPGHAELVFVVDGVGECHYAGGVPWRDRRGLEAAVRAIRTEHKDTILDAASALPAGPPRAVRRRSSEPGGQRDDAS